MRNTGIRKSTIALLGSMLLTIVVVGCGGTSPLVATFVTTAPAPVATVVAGSPVYSPYITGNNYQFILYSPAFAVVDSIASVAAFDNTGSPVTPWTLITTGANAPSQNRTDNTITILLTAGNNLPALDAVKKAIKPAVSAAGAAAAGGPAGSGTIVVTTMNGVVTNIPVKKVTVDPCGLN